MMTIPRVSLRRGDRLASVCPPTMQFKMRNPCMEKTFKTVGMIAPRYLDIHQRKTLGIMGITHPHENLACTIARVPSFGPKTALAPDEVSGTLGE